MTFQSYQFVDALLRSSGLKRLENPARGECLWTALATMMRRGDNWQSLRTEVLDYIASNSALVITVRVDIAFFHSHSFGILQSGIHAGRTLADVILVSTPSPHIRTVSSGRVPSVPQ